ncbi:hypothetical protein J2797_002847 [Paraburkholderia terricola]|nr:hypothetical protein [Paraburkholderia terricola]
MRGVTSERRTWDQSKALKRQLWSMHKAWDRSKR